MGKEEKEKTFSWPPPWATDDATATVGRQSAESQIPAYGRADRRRTGRKKCSEGFFEEEEGLCYAKNHAQALLCGTCLGA